jgi:hypothetical protein
MKGFQINIEEMKKKTEIEDKLLFNINKNLQEYVGNLEYVRKNFTQIESEFNLPNAGDRVELETKLFEYPNTIYYIFQCFYLKRKNYMGMNLTGLVQGKMETGLGFRSNIIKQNYNDIKDGRIKSNIIYKFGEPTTDIIIYKIKSSGFEWNKFNLDICEHYYIVVNLDTKKYFICV